MTNKSLWIACWLCLLALPVQAKVLVTNQHFFLTKAKELPSDKVKRMLVLGQSDLDFHHLEKLRQQISVDKMDWLLSGGQWKYWRQSSDQNILHVMDQFDQADIHVRPDNLCPEPYMREYDQFAILAIESNWFLFPHEIGVFSKYCEALDLGRSYREIEKAIINSRDKPLIVLAYHGLGMEREDVETNDLPLFQSLGGLQSFNNPSYQQYHQKITGMLKNRKNALFISGSGHSYAYTKIGALHHLNIPDSLPVAVSFTPVDDGVHVQTVDDAFEWTLTKEKYDFNPKPVCKTYAGKLRRFHQGGSFFRYWLGDNYRDAWDQPLEVPCFDLSHGPYTIERVGGSQQSLTFHLKHPSGREYKLRSFIKKIELPDILQETIIEDALLDHQSAIHPWGFWLSAKLSDEINLPHNHPYVVYVNTDQPAFKSFQETFKSGFYQMVEKPDNILSDPSYKAQGLEHVWSTQKMVRKLEGKSKYRMDQEAYLKARLFDILIGDWDRHKEQWKWMVFKEKDHWSIRPFPIDRDTAFYKGDGVFTWWGRRKWVNYTWQNYNAKLRHPESLMIQSMSMDHRYTSNVSKEKWKEIAQSIYEALPPEKVAAFLEQFPYHMPEADKKELLTAYTRRRDNFLNTAQQMRVMLHESLDILGTGQKDFFYITQPTPHTIQVRIEHDGETIFDNEYSVPETKEIRLYGLEGIDTFHVNMPHTVLTKVRIIGGKAEDHLLIQHATNKQFITAYDDDINITSDNHIHTKPYRLRYSAFYTQANARKLNVVAPTLFISSGNPDTQFMLGGGFIYRKAGFQSDPWASTHTLKANFLFDRAAGNAMYQGTWFDIWNRNDLQLTLDLGLPRFYGFFYGLGNGLQQIDRPEDDSFYWLRGKHVNFKQQLSFPITQFMQLQPYLQYRYRDFIFGQDHILSTPEENLLDENLAEGTNEDLSQDSHYVGMGLDWVYQSNDTVSGPLKKRNLYARLGWQVQKGLTGGDGAFQRVDLHTDYINYARRTKTQWKISAGGGFNHGNWEFFDAQFLGRNQNLRGFFINRFGGTARIYSSIEINQSLMQKKRPIITDAGLGMFLDNGRVYLDEDELSDGWHYVVGLQAWITLLDTIAFRPSYALPVREQDEGFWSFVLTTQL
jgi:hypothetical protein